MQIRRNSHCREESQLTQAGRPAGREKGNIPWANGGKTVRRTARFRSVLLTHALPESDFSVGGRFSFCVITNTRLISRDKKKGGKKMKKTNTTRILALIVTVVSIVLCLVSCGGNVAGSGTAYVVIENGEGASEPYTVYEVNLSKVENKNEGAQALLEYLASLEDSTLYYSASWGGGYGAYVNSIGALYPVGAQFIAVYTSNEADFATPDAYMPVVKTVDYNGKTLTYSGVGISQMNIKDGTVVLFRLESYS